MTYVPNLENNGRWDHIASEHELERAIRASNTPFTRIHEMPKFGLTWILVGNAHTIIRAGAMGGDVKAIEGGWVYDNWFSMRLDWDEITGIEYEEQS